LTGRLPRPGEWPRQGIHARKSRSHREGRSCRNERQENSRAARRKAELTMAGSGCVRGAGASHCPLSNGRGCRLESSGGRRSRHLAQPRPRGYSRVSDRKVYVERRAGPRRTGAPSEVRYYHRQRHGKGPARGMQPKSGPRRTEGVFHALRLVPVALAICSARAWTGTVTRPKSSARLPERTRFVGYAGALPSTFSTSPSLLTLAPKSARIRTTSGNVSEASKAKPQLGHRADQDK